MESDDDTFMVDERSATCDSCGDENVECTTVHNSTYRRDELMCWHCYYEMITNTS